MSEEFNERRSELLRFDDVGGALGVQRMSLHHTKAGVSSWYSNVGFLTEAEAEEAESMPDYVLSDTLMADMDTSVWQAVNYLSTSTKYLCKNAERTVRYGAVPEGEREGVFVGRWEDYVVKGNDGEVLYTQSDLKEAHSAGADKLGFALRLIVKDICDSGEFLSQKWYFARIAQEYFKEYPVSTSSAYLIGELYKELCTKLQYEGDLASYYQSLEELRNSRSRGAKATKARAEELRVFAVELFVELAKLEGPRLLLAPDEIKADRLMEEALKRQPNRFVHAGKPYSKEWFLRNIIEDRRLEIVSALERAS